MSLHLCPVTLREARAFVDLHHRHHRAPPGGLFAIGVLRRGAPFPPDAEWMCAVAIVGRPVSRWLDDDYTAEVTRLCTDGARNACSMLYAACWRAARAMGYRRLVTYTLQQEGGESLRAAGWRLIGLAGGGSWDRKSRPRVDCHPLQTKLRWEAV